MAMECYMSYVEIMVDIAKYILILWIIPLVAQIIYSSIRFIKDEKEGYKIMEHWLYEEHNPGNIMIKYLPQGLFEGASSFFLPNKDEIGDYIATVAVRSVLTLASIIIWPLTITVIIYWIILLVLRGIYRVV